MKLILLLCLLPIVHGLSPTSHDHQHCCIQGPPGQAGIPGTPGTPGTPGMPGPHGGCETGHRWKQCVWTYSTSNDDTDNGQIHVCQFTKLDNDSYLHVVYMGNLRISNCTNCCKRWYFTFNRSECGDPAAIDGTVYQNVNLTIHRPANIEGYCGGIPAGMVQVGFNVGNCGGGYNPGNAWTSWNQANRIIIEEVDPPAA